MKKQLSLIIAAALLGGSLPSSASAREKRPWKDTAEVSIVSTNGNSKTLTTAAKNLFDYAWAKAALELAAGGLGSRNQDVVTAEKYSAHEKLSFKFSGKNYFFERFGWTRNRFAGFWHRWDMNLGAGREFLGLERHTLNGEAGFGYVAEERIIAEDQRFGSGRLYSKYGFRISETAKFFQDAEYSHNFKDPENYRIDTETALVASINSVFSIKLSYVWNRVGKPSPGFARDDSTTSVGLIANF